MGSLRDEHLGASPAEHVCARALVEVSHGNRSEKKFAEVVTAWKSSTSGGLLTRSSRRAAVEAAAGRRSNGKNAMSDSVAFFGLPELFELTHLTQKEAAAVLKVSVQAFKKRCSELGIKDWRAISKSLKKLATTRKGHHEECVHVHPKSPAPPVRSDKEKRANLGPPVVDNAAVAATTSTDPGILHYLLKSAKDLRKAAVAKHEGGVDLRPPSVRSDQRDHPSQKQTRRKGSDRTPRIVEENGGRQSDRPSRENEARRDEDLLADCMRYKELLEFDTTTTFLTEGEVAKMKRTFEEGLRRLQKIFGDVQAKVTSMHQRRLAGNPPGGLADRLRGAEPGTSQPSWPSTRSQGSDPNWGATYQQYYDVLIVYLGAPLTTTLLEQHRRGVSSLYHHVDTMATWLIGLGYGGDNWDEGSFRELLRDLSSGLLDPRPILSSLLKHKNLEPPPYVVQTIWREGLNGSGRAAIS